jgi:iron complex outermembrane recepter protein
MKRIYTSIVFLLFGFSLVAQSSLIKGEVKDAKTKEGLLGANVVVKGAAEATSCDLEGDFELRTKQAFPITLEISYIGYETKTIKIDNNREKLKIELSEPTSGGNLITEIQVIARGPSEKVRESNKTTISLGATQIKEAVSGFYNAAGNAPGVDLTTASLGFTVINTRGFNSTAPVRSLQIIDGVDNQAPGLNFSLGNFLGASELDVKKFDLIVGASSSLYGPNAFNGVVSIDTKHPTLSKGLSASVKYGERNLLEAAIRYAGTAGDKFSYKVNLFHFRAHDWEAQNYSAVTGTRTTFGNPGRFDAVNIYGDEFNVSGDNSKSTTDKIGLGVFHRTGYREVDLVDYNTRNYKANVGLYYALDPKQGMESPRIEYAFNFGSGTTVYQGDNRFRLKNILFMQNKIELRKDGKYFLRAYTTKDDAGDSYDPYATAIRLQEKAKGDGKWYSDYNDFWRVNFDPKALKYGYPQVKIIINPDGTIGGSFDQAAADKWVVTYKDTLAKWHQIAEKEINKQNLGKDAFSKDFLYPGSPSFKKAFDSLVTSPANKRIPGTKFVDHSALYHVHGEYRFEPKFTDEVIVGANFRQYTPISEGTIFYDTAGIKIRNREFGFYAGIKKKMMNSRLTFDATMRVDKNQNFEWLPSPAASFVYNPNPSKNDTYWRVSFSSAIRNPTLTDQYLALNVGRAILAGNIDGRKGLITLPSFFDYLNTGQSFRLKRFDIDGVRPEKVKTFETGLRKSFNNKVFIDLSYYFSAYKKFIGYNVAIDGDTTGGILKNIQAYRFATNSKGNVTSQGATFSLDYFINKHYTFNGNYSWNTLVKADENDPIIPAFNTPKQKFNIGLSGRDFKDWGFRVNYKWVEGFTFEGSPQFSGFINSYGLLDVQVNKTFYPIHTVLKIGASNVLNNLHYEVYGGPLVGRLAYISLLYDMNVKK